MRDPTHHREWLASVLGPEGEEVTCERCFAVLDRYVEIEQRAEDAEASFPGMRSHLEGCPACREEHDLLLALLEES